MGLMMRDLGLDHLSVQQRFELLGEIWDSIAAGSEPPPMSDARRQELERRLAAHEADPKSAVAWELVKAETLKRLQG